jgi:hypothetical protein
MHAAMELRLRDKTPLPEEFAALEGVAAACENLQGKMTVEGELALTEDLTPTSFFAPDVWFRGKADLIVHDEKSNSVTILDWKTGKPKDEFQQLQIMAVCAFYTIPNLKKIKVAFVYTKTGTVDKKTFTAEQIPDLVATMRHSARGVYNAYATGVFPPQPNGLCKNWCEVKSCSFYGIGKSGGGKRW